MARYDSHKRPATHKNALFFFAFIVITLSQFVILSSNAYSGESRNILVLHSYHQGYDWTDNINHGILSTITKGKSDEVNIFVEYMDTKRYGLKEMLPTLIPVYQQKYQGKGIDVIIACDDNALEMLMLTRDSIFTNIPVVFCGINSRALYEKAQKHGFTGVMDNKDIKGTIDIALKLLPSIQKIAVISDNTTTGKILFRQYQELAGSYANRLDFIELVGLNNAELALRLKTLPANTAILLLSLFSIADGDSFSMQSAIDFVSANTNAPIFILNDVYLGKGVVGGSVVSGINQGAKAAELAKLVLKGVNPRGIPLISDDTTVPMLDYAVLSKLGIPMANVPPDSILINKPYSLYDEYAVYIWTVIFIIIAQGISIALLITSNIKKKRAEKALRFSEIKYRTIFETANEGIWVGDKNQNSIMVNDIMARMLGYSEQEMIGHPINAFMHPDELEDHEIQIEKRIRGIDATYERRFITKTGETIWCLVSAKSVTNEQGSFDGSFAMITDISDRKLVENRLLAAKEKAEEANMAKDEFLANMSHELRTPLNGILGMLQLIQATAQSEEQKEYTSNAITASRRLTGLLSDLLDISRIEARKMEIRKEVFRIRNAITGVMELFNTAAKEKNIQLSVYIDEGIPFELVGDSPRLQQILINIIGNAIKFTDAGYVKVEAVRLSQIHPTQERVLFIVSDSGIGIPDDKIDSVFDSFTQGEESYTRKHQGAGLGLQIVKRLTLLMKGNLTLSSDQGIGTVVHVTLPFDLACSIPDKSETDADSHLLEELPAKSPYKRALVVEDDRINRISLTRQLEKYGLDVSVAEDGQMALEAVANTTFDIIFMDIQMPNMDGMMAAKRIRSDPRYKNNKDVPIIAITAYAMSGDRDRFLESGMNNYIAKPFDSDDLQRVLFAKETG